MRILLADDERDMTEALAAMLAHAQYLTDTVHNGEDALYYALEGEYDLIILDVMMPDLDGFQVLERLRSKNNDTPVLMLTAKSAVEDRVHGLRHGADDYLTKPFAMEEFLARVEVLLRRPRRGEDKHTHNDLVFERFQSRIAYGDVSVQLSNKEFQLLELLYVHSGRVYSAEQLLTSVWGYDAEVDQSVLWTNISSLRRKLEDNNIPYRIQNRRGVGYSLERRTDVS